jgi:hypothetical protein
VLEALIWCPACDEERFKLWTMPSGSSGHRTNILEPVPVHAEHKVCAVCDGPLERRDPPPERPPP